MCVWYYEYNWCSSSTKQWHWKNCVVYLTLMMTYSFTQPWNDFLQFSWKKGESWMDWKARLIIHLFETFLVHGFNHWAKLTSALSLHCKLSNWIQTYTFLPGIITKGRLESSCWVSTLVTIINTDDDHIPPQPGPPHCHLPLLTYFRNASLVTE